MERKKMEKFITVVCEREENEVTLRVFHHESGDSIDIGTFHLHELHGSVRAFESIINAMVQNPNYTGREFSITMPWLPFPTDGGFEPAKIDAGYYQQKQNAIVPTLEKWIQETLFYQEGSNDSAYNAQLNGRVEAFNRVLELAKDIEK
jgi:hypothetical protein